MFHANLAGKIIGKCCGVRKIIASLRVLEQERPYHVWLEKYTAMLNSKILCNSAGLADFALSKGFPKTKIQVIPNSFDAGIFSYIKREKPKNQVWKLLFLGRVSSQKGLPFLISGLQTLKENGIQFCLNIVGVAEVELKSELEVQITEAGLEEEIAFHDACAHHQVPEIMREYHLLVLPSLWEGMPNAVMEAFASGLPVVATDIPGTNELVKDGDTGLLAKPSNGASLAEKLQEAVENYDLCLDMTERANRMLLEKYNPKVIHNKYRDLYEK